MFITSAKASEAATVLGLDLATVTEAAVKHAYREAAKHCHPDGDNHDPVRWAKISWAKEALARWLTSPPTKPPLAGVTLGDCRACGGTGRVKKGSLSMFCVLCDGTGNKKERERDS